MPDSPGARFSAVVVGVSTGGVRALRIMLGSLPHDFPMPVIIVAHIMPGSDNGLATLLDMQCPIRIKEADEHDKPEAGTAYLAPANYHLLVERDRSFSLSADPPVCFARPSADVLFESAAEAYGPALIGVILTGAGSDGSRGLIKIKDRGGVVIVQDPSDAEMKDMPMNALRSVKADFVEPLDRIAPRLAGLVNAAGTVSMHNMSSTDAMGRPL